MLPRKLWVSGTFDLILKISESFMMTHEVCFFLSQSLKSFTSQSQIFKQRSRFLSESQILPFATPSWSQLHTCTNATFLMSHTCT